MIKRRIAWIIIILAAAAAYLFSNGTVTLAVLAAVIAVPVVSAVMLAASGRNLDVSLYVSEQEPSYNNGNRDGTEVSGPASDKKNVRIHYVNNSVIPVANAEADVTVRNFRTGEWHSPENSTGCYIGSRGTADAETGFVPVHAGSYEMQLTGITIYDPLHLFRRRISAGQRYEFTLRPEQFDMTLDISSSSSAILESDKYSRVRQGNDPGEVRSIREYVPGDPVKNIHWKLSEKMDKILVKELSLPVTDDLLIVLGACSSSAGYQCMDACASVYASIISAALAEGHSISAGWIDTGKGGAVIRKISDDQQAVSAADEYLACPAASGQDIIRTALADSRYAHIVIVGGMVPDGISSLASGSMITALVCGQSGTGGAEGVVVTGFDETGYESQLSRLEI